MLVVKYSEIMLKSKMTRVILERMLEWNLKSALEGRRFKLSREGGIFFIDVDEERKCAEKLRKVFGIANISICDVVPAEFDRIAEKCVAIGREFKRSSSFAIRAKRVGEHSFSSRELCIEGGRRILEELRDKKLKVDLDEPDEEIFIDVREGRAFVSRGCIKAYGGIPLGSQGKVVAVITDRNSYIAAWMMMRRGCEVIAVCNSKRGCELAEKLRDWHIGRRMEVYDLSSKDSKIGKEELFREAGRVTRENCAGGVVSGESLCKNKKLAELKKLAKLAGVPVYRPLILLEDEMGKMVVC
jgi:thiamine biosynthesis protein ThiI